MKGLCAVIILSLVSLVKSQCISFDSAICNDVILSYPTKTINSTQLQASITETLLVSYGFKNLSIVGPMLFPECYLAARNFLCSYLYVECGTNDKILPCRTICDNFYTQCESFVSQFPTDALPKCESLPTSGCNDGANYPALRRETIECPAPLIRNPNPEIKRDNCPGDICCIPCPISKYIFAVGAYENLYNFLSTSFTVFFFFCLISLLSYLIIPTKRKFPQTMIASIFASATIAYISNWISVFSKPEDLFCQSEVQTALPGYAPTSCIVQGIFFIYGLLSTVLWFFCFSANIFMAVILKLDTIKYQYFYHALSWGLPFILVTILAASNQIGTNVAPICAIPNQNWSNGIFHIPTAVFIFPAFVMNMIILVKVIQISIELKRSMWYVLKLQARPFIFTVYGVFVFIFNWVYTTTYDIKLEEWQTDWIICLGLGEGHQTCSNIPKPYMNLPLIYSVYFVVGTFSFVGFLLFTFKKEVLDGWYFAITKKHLPQKLRGTPTTFTTTKNQSSNGISESQTQMTPTPKRTTKVEDSEEKQSQKETDELDDDQIEKKNATTTDPENQDQRH